MAAGDLHRWALSPLSFIGLTKAEPDIITDTGWNYFISIRYLKLFLVQTGMSMSISMSLLSVHVHLRVYVHVMSMSVSLSMSMLIFMQHGHVTWTGNGKLQTVDGKQEIGNMNINMINIIRKNEQWTFIKHWLNMNRNIFKRKRFISDIGLLLY